MTHTGLKIYRSRRLHRSRRSAWALLCCCLALALICGAQPGSMTRAQSTLKPVPPVDAEASALLEIGVPSKPRSAPRSLDALRIVSYNIRWRGGDDLRELITLLRNDPEIGQATIIGLQEVDRNRKRTGNVNTVRLVAEELGMYYAWAAPPSPPTKDKKPQEEETGVAILSAYPLADVRRIVLPHEGPKGRRRAGVGATVQIDNAPVRVYSVHGETRMNVDKKVDALEAVLDDLATYDKTMRAVVLGDFNTIEAEAIRDVTTLFTKAGFTTPFTNNEETWKTFILKLKLDWLWLRNLRATQHGIDRKIGLSDHWPLWTTVTMK
jgi:endonuclease/exonuclease/phosphatase family metal-dependent hydrolase